MEKDLATPLVERSATGYILTKVGEELSKSASKIEKELLPFEASSAGQSDDISGELRVTAIANMASSMLMPIFSRFANAYPKIDFHLEVTNDSVRLAERDADVALRQTNVPSETLIGSRLTTIIVRGSNRQGRTLIILFVLMRHRSRLLLLRRG